MRWIPITILLAACSSPVSEPKKKPVPEKRSASGLPIGLPITMHKLVPEVRWSYWTAKKHLRKVYTRLMGALNISGTGCKDFGENAKVWHIGFQDRGARIRWYKMLCFRTQGFSFVDYPETFYCRCKFNPKTMRMLSAPFRDRCSRYNVSANTADGIVQWDHVVPVSAFGKHRSCWKKGYCKKRLGKSMGSRECCRAMNMTFRKMEANLVNLVPVVKTLNVACKPRDGKKAKPDRGRLGKIARIRLYMRTAYSGQFAEKLTREQYWRLMEFSEAHTPHYQEEDRNGFVSRIQPFGNPLVDSAHRCGRRK